MKINPHTYTCSPLITVILTKLHGVHIKSITSTHCYCYSKSIHV